MNKRCIVNVATGDFYCKMQTRLAESFKNSVDRLIINFASHQQSPVPANDDKGIDLMLWRDCLPTGSRPHAESPYGFKVHAIKAAYEKGYTSILWLDSPAYAVKEDISPIFKKIEKHGYYLMSHTDPLENWVGGTALEYFKIDRSRLKGKNLPSGSCFGFNLKNSIVKHHFDHLVQYENIGLFSDDILYQDNQVVWKHRHDEAIMALQLLRLDAPVFTFDPLFQSDSDECVIRSGDFGPMEQVRATA